VLVLVNVLSINLSALAVLSYQGYRPESWLRVEAARTATLKRIAVLAAAILVLSVFLAATTYSSYQAATFENTAESTVTDALASPPYEALQFLGMQVTYSETVPFKQPSRVVIRVGLPPTVDRPPDLPTAMQSAIRDATGRTVEVEIQYVEVQST